MERSQVGLMPMKTFEAATRTCPFCAEKIRAEAKKCKHCGELLDAELRQQHEEKSRWKPNLGIAVRAGGGLGVFGVVYLVNPAGLKRPNVAKRNPVQRKSKRGFEFIDKLPEEFGAYCEGPPEELALRVAIARHFVKGVSKNHLISANSGVWRESKKSRKFVQRTQIVNSTLDQLQEFVVHRIRQYQQDAEISDSQAAMSERWPTLTKWQG